MACRQSRNSADLAAAAAAAKAAPAAAAKAASAVLHCQTSLHRRHTAALPDHDASVVTPLWLPLP